MGLKTRLETETKSPDSIIDGYSYMQFGFTAITPASNYSPMKNKNKFRIYQVES